MGGRRGAEVYRTKIASIVAVVFAREESKISDKSKGASAVVDADTLHTSSPAIAFALVGALILQ